MLAAFFLFLSQLDPVELPGLPAQINRPNVKDYSHYRNMVRYYSLSATYAISRGFYHLCYNNHNRPKVQPLIKASQVIVPPQLPPLHRVQVKTPDGKFLEYECNLRLATPHSVLTWYSQLSGLRYSDLYLRTYLKPLHQVQSTLHELTIGPNTTLIIECKLRGGNGLHDTSQAKDLLLTKHTESPSAPQCNDDTPPGPAAMREAVHNTPDCTSTSSRTRKKKNQKEPKEARQLNIHTVNLNGALSRDTVDPNEIPTYVNRHSPDVLLLIDHRGTDATLNATANRIQRATRKDVKVFNCAAAPSKKPTSNGFRETQNCVGGVAIILIGHVTNGITEITQRDPSGAGTFLSVKVQYGHNLPPLYITAVYLFPNSRGPLTVNQRIEKYLQQECSRMTPKAWQRDQLDSMLTKHTRAHAHAVQIIGGDFNHNRDKWARRGHPLTSFFLDKHDLVNHVLDHDPHKQINTCRIKMTAKLVMPTNPTFIDHILTRNLAHVSHAAYPKDPIVQITDHAPLAMVAELPLPFLQLDLDDDIHYSAQQGNTYTDLNQNSPAQVVFFQQTLRRLFDNSLLAALPTAPTLGQLNNRFYQLSEAILGAATSTRDTFLPKKADRIHNWCPENILLRNYLNALQEARSKLASKGVRQMRRTLERFLRYHTNYKHRHRNKSDQDDEEIHIYQEHMVMHGLEPAGVNTLLTHMLDERTPVAALPNLLATEYARIWHCNHARQRAHNRAKISEYLRRQDQAMELGKLRKTIQWLKGCLPRLNVGPIMTSGGEIITQPKEIYTAAAQHFQAHFAQGNTWITSSGLDEETPEGQTLRESILHGTWRITHGHIIPPELPPRTQEDIGRLLDTMRIKVNATVRAELDAALHADISFETFREYIFGRKGKTTPGLTGVTANMLKGMDALIDEPDSDSLLALLHTTLHQFWDQKEVPEAWLDRIMALIPKSADKQTLDNLRPIMLLDTTRKIWLSILSHRQQSILMANNCLNHAQCGGIPGSGTEDAILAIQNCIEDAHEFKQELHILGADKKKAFDSPSQFIIYMAWRRLGIPHDIAMYYKQCDKNNRVRPKTTHFINQPNDCEPFHAECGVPQGDPLSCPSYGAIEDIIVDFLDTHLAETDPYLFADNHGTLHPQRATLFVDDLTTVSRSRQGTQRTLELLQAAGIVLNIHLNPQKTWHIPIEWTYDRHFRRVQRHTACAADPLTGMDHKGEIQAIPTLLPSQMQRLLGAQISGSNNHTTLHSKARLDADRVVASMSPKRAKIKHIYPVMLQAVYPQLAYPLSFSTIPNQGLKHISVPLRALIKKRTHTSNFADATIFGRNATGYTMQYTDLMDYVNGRKFGILNRMTGGNARQQLVMECMIGRGLRQRHTPTYPREEPHECNCHTLSRDEVITAQKTKTPPYNQVHTAIWAESLIEWIQEGGGSIHLKSST